MNNSYIGLIGVVIGAGIGFLFNFLLQKRKDKIEITRLLVSIKAKVESELLHFRAAVQNLSYLNYKHHYMMGLKNGGREHLLDGHPINPTLKENTAKIYIASDVYRNSLSLITSYLSEFQFYAYNTEIKKFYDAMVKWDVDHHANIESFSPGTLDNMNLTQSVTFISQSIETNLQQAVFDKLIVEMETLIRNRK
jgi:hypothetical protein